MTTPPPPSVPHLPGYQPGVPPAGYRPLSGSENTEGVQQNAMRLWKELHNEPYGAMKEFEVDGQKYIARKEQHYHAPGFKGERKGWGPTGWHEGTSVFKSIDQTPSGPTASGREQFFQRLMTFLQSLEKEV
jgi:hypothetical protein